MRAEPQIGLALSGGGVRGLAHLGVLQVLEELDVPVHMIAGTSMGGLVGGLYAAGVPIGTLIARATKAGIMDFASPDRSWRGLFQHAKLSAFLSDLLGGEDITFADLNVPLTVVATDVESGELVLLDRGPLIPALLATSAFPIVFAPVRHQGRWLVDGGVLNNFPIDVVRHMGADRVLGVTVPPSVTLPLEPTKRAGSLPARALFSFTNRTRDWKLPFLIGETTVSFATYLITETRLSLCPPDVLIEIRLPNVGVFTTSRNAKVIETGRAAAQRRRKELVALRARPLPPRWVQEARGLARRLQRAWRAFRQPPYPRYP